MALERPLSSSLSLMQMACSTWPMVVGVMLIWSFHAFVNAETCNQVEVEEDAGTHGNAMLQTRAKPHRATAEETDVMVAAEEAEDVLAHKRAACLGMSNAEVSTTTPIMAALLTVALAKGDAS